MNAWRILILLVCSAGLAGCSSVVREGKLRSQPEWSAFTRGWFFAEPSAELQRSKVAGMPLNFTSAHLVAGNRLVATTERFGVLVFNKLNGELLSRRNVPGGVSTEALVVEEKVFIGSTEGFFYRLPLEGSGEDWSVDLRFPVIGRPVSLNGRILVGTEDGAFHALDAATGKVLWTYRRQGVGNITSIRGGGNPVVIGGKFWVGLADGSLVVLEPNDGTVIQEKQYRDNLKFTDIDSAPVPLRNGVLISTYDGRLRYIKRNGLPIWTYTQGSANPPLPVPAARTIFLPGSDGTVYSLSESSGKRNWSFAIPKGVPTGLGYFAAEPKYGLANGILVVATSDNYVYALDAKTGKQVQRLSLGSSSGSYGTIAVDQSRREFYLVSHFGRVFQFRLGGLK